MRYVFFLNSQIGSGFFGHGNGFRGRIEWQALWRSTVNWECLFCNFFDVSSVCPWLSFVKINGQFTPMFLYSWFVSQSVITTFFSSFWGIEWPDNSLKGVSYASHISVCALFKWQSFYSLDLISVILRSNSCLTMKVRTQKLRNRKRRMLERPRWHRQQQHRQRRLNLRCQF